MGVALPSRRESGRFASEAVRTLIRRRLAELGAMLIALAGMAMLVALVSYDARDPSLNTATAGVAHNLAGRPGAMLADALLQGFGLAGALPVLALLAWAWRIGSHRGVGNLPLRIAALLAALPVSAGVFSALPGLLGVPLAWPTPAGLGGASGAVLKGDVLAAGAGLIGRFGPPIVWALAAVLTL